MVISPADMHLTFCYLARSMVALSLCVRPEIFQRNVAYGLDGLVGGEASVLDEIRVLAPVVVLQVIIQSFTEGPMESARI